MKFITKLKFAGVFSIFISILFVCNVNIGQVRAEENKPKVQQKQENSENKKASDTDAYKYIAQTNDSYSLMARKAIQTYGINKKINLNKAQIIYAETMLTQASDSPILRVGQSVTIKQSAVKNWTEKAQKLSKNDINAWNAYTVGVNFNTDAVGEARAHN